MAMTAGLFFALTADIMVQEPLHAGQAAGCTAAAHATDVMCL
jgi:hypothetical protein